MDAYEGSTFREVRDLAFSDPYTAGYPSRKATLRSQFEGCKNLLWRDNQTLLTDRSDVVPYFDKLLHPSGICFGGTWRITEDSEYTGLFARGTEALILVRCSAPLGRTTSARARYRGFGLAGKIFPTMDPDERVDTANFVLIDVLGGSKAARFTDQRLTNEPALGINASLLKIVGVVVHTVVTFQLIDKKPTHRTLADLAGVGVAPGAARAPHWMQTHHESANGQSDEPDLRDELKLEHYADGVLRFVVSVAPDDPDGVRRFRPIGEIVLDECVVSASGDHRIRFYHRPNRARATN